MLFRSTAWQILLSACLCSSLFPREPNWTDVRKGARSPFTMHSLVKNEKLCGLHTNCRKKRCLDWRSKIEYHCEREGLTSKKQMQTHRHSHSCAHTHSNTHIHTHTHTHKRTHARANTHTLKSERKETKQNKKKTNYNNKCHSQMTNRQFSGAVPPS